MVKKAIWIIVLVLISAYLVNSHIKNKAEEEAKEAEKKSIEETVIKSVTQLIERTNAIDNWEEALKHKQIITADLERLWLTDRPILFIGAIKDISTADNENYLIEIETSIYSYRKYIFDSELFLQLNYPKDKLDLFIKTYPDIFTRYGRNNGVAVAALINKIETRKVVNTAGEGDYIKIGKGNCIDLVYTGRVRFK